MAVFADTSALYAVLDADDANHGKAAAEWRRLLEAGEPLVTTNYVLVETAALVQHRLGMEALRVLQQDAAPVIGVKWIDERAHEAGVAAVLAAGRRGLSLVDCASFGAMRHLGIREVFAFDPDFAEQGFSCLPAPE